MECAKMESVFSIMQNLDSIQDFRVLVSTSLSFFYGGDLFPPSREDSFLLIGEVTSLNNWITDLLLHSVLSDPEDETGQDEREFDPSTYLDDDSLSCSSALSTDLTPWYQNSSFLLSFQKEVQSLLSFMVARFVSDRFGEGTFVPRVEPTFKQEFACQERTIFPSMYNRRRDVGPCA